MTLEVVKGHGGQLDLIIAPSADVWHRWPKSSDTPFRPFLRSPTSSQRRFGAFTVYNIHFSVLESVWLTDAPFMLDTRRKYSMYMYSANQIFV